MKLIGIAVCFTVLFSLPFLASCDKSEKGTIIEMELTENYDTSDPLIHEKLFYVSDSIDTLTLDVSFQMEGKSGLLEVADNETKQVYWNESWNGKIEKNAFTISLDALEKEREYVVRFTGTEIKYASIRISSDSKLMKERERPEKPQKDKG